MYRRQISWRLTEYVLRRQKYFRKLTVWIFPSQDFNVFYYTETSLDDKSFFFNNKIQPWRHLKPRQIVIFQFISVKL